MIIWPLLISLYTVAFAQDMAIQEYCFSSTERMNQVMHRLKFILVPSDEIQRSERCATIKSSPHRRELIQGYLRKLEPEVQINFSSAEIKRDPCRLKVERIKNLKNETTAVDGNLQTTGVTVAASNQIRSQESTEVMSIQTLQDFELNVQQNVIKGTCKALTPGRYEISLEVRKDAPNLYPQLPPGTIINQANLPLPKNQETSKLMTTLQLSTGQKIEIGRLIKDLKEKNKEIDLPSGAEANQMRDESSEQVFISLE
jgi:hypothetical protein